MTKKRRLLIIGAIVVVILIVGAIVYWVIRMNQTAAEIEQTSKSSSGTQQYKSSSDLAGEVNTKYGNGDFEGAIKLIEGQQNADDPANQLLLAQAYANSGNFTKALEIYKKLDSASKLPNNQLSNAASTAEQANDIKTAIEYYKRAEAYARTSKDENLDQADVYAYKVAELEKKQ